MVEKAYDKLIHILRKFTNNTKRNDEEDCKRTINYLEWSSLKTDIVNTEKKFTLPDNIDEIVKDVMLFGFILDLTRYVIY